MLVRDAGESWQIVLQPDHADLSAQLVRAWSPRPEPFRSLEVVARRHDDGWAVWERAPSLDAEGRPRNFLDVEVPLHLAFYRAVIAAVTADDPYAGLLLSMHGAGIYTGRYGTQPSMKLRHAAEVKRLVAAFVREQEQGYEARIASLEVPDEDRWRDYKLLQIWDRLSLYFCLKDVETGEADTIEPVPLDGKDAALRIEPRGSWRVAIDPYPFAKRQTEFTLLRRLLPKKPWADSDAFRADFLAARPEPTAIVAEPL